MKEREEKHAALDPADAQAKPLAVDHETVRAMEPKDLDVKDGDARQIRGASLVGCQTR